MLGPAGPYLSLSAYELSASSGDNVLASIDFPASEANLPFVLLMSCHGDGPTWINGVEVPLTPCNYFRRMLRYRWTPPIIPVTLVP